VEKARGDPGLFVLPGWRWRRSRWQGIKARRGREAVVPSGPARGENVGIDGDAGLGVQAARGHDKQAHRRAGQRRATERTEAPGVPRSWKLEAADVLLAGQPRQRCRGREKVGGMSRAGILATARAMAQ